MALIKCPECGKEISDKSEKCINCGCPISDNQTKTPQDEGSDIKYLYNDAFVNKEKRERSAIQKGEFVSARMVVSILMLVFSSMVLFQSCAVGLSNVVGETGDVDGSIGMLISFSMILFGIIGIVTKNTKSYKSLRTIATIACLVFMFCVFIYDGAFKDLTVWGWMFGAYSFIFILSSDAMKKNKNNL